MQEQQNNFDNQFLNDSLSYESYSQKGPAKQYSGSSYQLETYSKLEKDDALYKAFITQTYGSFENFKNTNKIFTKGNIFDPSVDYSADVTVITEDSYYKTDHISSSEVILEALTGICSFNFLKLDGTTTKVNGTLDKRYIQGKELTNRSKFFSPLRGDRIVVWDLNKQSWSSFYMNRLFKFVRDDTSGLE
jgi:hypothetical protein